MREPPKTEAAFLAVMIELARQHSSLGCWLRAPMKYGKIKDLEKEPTKQRSLRWFGPRKDKRLT